jgi:hypothetical protein
MPHALAHVAIPSPRAAFTPLTSHTPLTAWAPNDR